MHGPMLEWVEDCWNESYQGAPNDGSAWTSGDLAAGCSAWALGSPVRGTSVRTAATVATPTSGSALCATDVMGWEGGAGTAAIESVELRDSGGRDRRMLSNHLGEAAMLRVRAVVLASALILAPFGAWGADLVVWWDKGFYPQEDEAVREIIAAFEQKTGKQVELVQVAQIEMFQKAQAALEAGQPPDFLFGATSERCGRPVGLQGPACRSRGRPRPGPGPVRRRHDRSVHPARRQHRPTQSLCASDGPVFQPRPCLEQPPGAGRLHARRHSQAVGGVLVVLVRPGAARRAQGRGPRRHLGRGAAHVRGGKRHRRRAPAVRPRLWHALARPRPPASDGRSRGAGGDHQGAADLHGDLAQGLHAAELVNWTNIDNNKAFLAQTVVMTANTSLSIPGALRTARPDDYYKNAATIDWPDGADGQPLVIVGFIQRAVVFKAGGNPALAKDFVRFLAEEGWLAHWLDFAGDRYMPPMRKLVEQPFWLDPSDPHRMRAAIQILTQPHRWTWKSATTNGSRARYGAAMSGATPSTAS